MSADVPSRQTMRAALLRDVLRQQQPSPIVACPKTTSMNTPIQSAFYTEELGKSKISKNVIAPRNLDVMPAGHNYVAAPPHSVAWRSHLSNPISEMYSIK